MWVKNNGASRLASTKRTNRTSDNGGSLQQTSGLAKPGGTCCLLGIAGTRLDARRLGRGKPPTSRRFPIGHDVFAALLLETPSSFEIVLQ
jgi:hypothetical protein